MGAFTIYKGGVSYYGFTKNSKESYMTELKPILFAFATTNKDLGLEITVEREDGQPENDGYRIAIHNPSEVIDESYFHTKINFQQPSLILVTPEMVTFDESFAAMSPKE